MPNPMNVPAGISTATKGTALQKYPMPDPTKVYTYFQDFTTYVAADWTITAIGTGAVAAVADEPFGAIAATNSAADNDGLNVQLDEETFTPTSGKKMWFKARFKVSDATQSDFMIGLAVLDTTLLGSTAGDGVTDGIFFAKEDGDTNLDFHVQKDTTTGQKSTSAIATVDTSYMTVGFEFDGARYVKVFVDDVHKSTVDLSSTLATYLPNTPLAVSFAILNGEAVAKSMTVDYIFAAIER